MIKRSVLLSNMTVWLHCEGAVRLLCASAERFQQERQAVISSVSGLQRLPLDYFPSFTIDYFLK